jgi:hypothetical protein
VNLYVLNVRLSAATSDIVCHDYLQRLLGQEYDDLLTNLYSRENVRLKKL